MPLADPEGEGFLRYNICVANLILVFWGGFILTLALIGVRFNPRCDQQKLAVLGEVGGRRSVRMHRRLGAELRAACRRAVTAQRENDVRRAATTTAFGVRFATVPLGK